MADIEDYAMKGTYHGLPGRWFDDSTAVDGKRFVASVWSWRKIKAILVDVCESRCEECGAFEKYGDPHHVYGRGVGGSKREDRPVVWYGDKMVRMIRYLCRKCHDKAVIKPWGSWREENNELSYDSPDVRTLPGQRHSVYSPR